MGFVARALPGVSLAFALALACGASAAGASGSSVTVTLVDFRIHLSSGAVPPGVVRFRVINRGNLTHNFAIGRARTRALPHGGQQTLTVSFPEVGVYRFSSSLPGQSALGMTGLLRVARGTVPSRALTTTSRLVLTKVATGLGPLTDAVAPPGDRTRLLVVQQDGLVVLYENGTRQAQPFADLRSVVGADGEKGLLSLAFAPDYETSGLLYAYYNNRNGDVRVVELHRSATNPDTVDSSRRRLLAITKPTADHNGGMMQFGPDGSLYIAIGDGGADPPAIPVGEFGQTLDDLFGSIIRIDPRHGDPYAVPPGNPFAATPGARPEIVAYGLRNPWRFWIDAGTSTMLIGDVGEGSREEIDRLPLDRLGLDFGWPCREGTVVPPNVQLPAACADAKLTPPIFEYAHSKKRCSIIGGVVAHDPRIRALDGLYLWSDLCDGGLYALAEKGGGGAAVPLGVSAPVPTSFGVDAAGRVYVTTATGSLYRLDVSSASGSGTPTGTG
jgi:glucose/arabinose dehydrogenase